jgi:hypothetical protein
MFLMSDAFRDLDERQWRGFDWQSTTILFVSWVWGPNGGPEALAGRRLVGPLLEAGARVHVLTGWEPDPGIQDANCDVTVVPRRAISDNKIVRTWQMMRCGVPEAAGLWVAEAVRAGDRVLRSLPGNPIIYGRAMPGTSNIVAWHLWRRTGLPWVAHFSDPWPGQLRSSRWNVFASYKWPMFQAWRRRIFRDAGALTFTNPYQAADILGAQHRRYLSKAFVVTHLPSEPTRMPPAPRYDVFHIVHTGSFYSLDSHTSATLMKGLRSFLDRTPAAHGRVRFTQAGWADGDFDEWVERCRLQAVARNVGRLPPSEIPTLLDSANLLVGVDYARPDSTTLLSKLPDYVHASRPILVITSPTSVMGRLFSEDGVGLTAANNSPDEVAERIGLIFAAWQQRRADAFLPRPSAFESFARERALAELAAAFVVARGRAVQAPDSDSHRVLSGEKAAL